MSTARNCPTIPSDLIHLLSPRLRSRSSLAPENLFLREHVAFYQEREIKPRQADNLTRFTLVLLSRSFDWRVALIIVRPKTFLGWNRRGFGLWWRIANELLLTSDCRRQRDHSQIMATVTAPARQRTTWRSALGDLPTQSHARGIVACTSLY